jgi:hypothetical protein
MAGLGHGKPKFSESFKGRWSRHLPPHAELSPSDPAEVFAIGDTEASSAHRPHHIDPPTGGSAK